MSKLTSYLTKRLEAWVEVPGFEGFEVKLAYITREELNRIRTDCTGITYSPKNRQTTETFDADKFLKQFIGACVLGWKGFTVRHAKQLLPIVIDETTVNLDDEIEYTPEDAIVLLRQSTFFDDWLNEAVFDLQTFRRNGTGADI